MHAHLAREDQVALQPGNVKILIAGRDDEKRIDVRGNELQSPAAPQRAPLEQVYPSKDADRLECLAIASNQSPTDG